MTRSKRRAPGTRPRLSTSVAGLAAATGIAPNVIYWGLLGRHGGASTCGSARISRRIASRRIARADSAELRPDGLREVLYLELWRVSVDPTTTLRVCEDCRGLFPACERHWRRSFACERREQASSGAEARGRDLRCHAVERWSLSPRLLPSRGSFFWRRVSCDRSLRTPHRTDGPLDGELHINVIRRISARAGDIA
jgi:hypothetical protein